MSQYIVIEGRRNEDGDMWSPTYEFDSENEAIGFARSKADDRMWCHVIDIRSGSIIFNSVTYRNL